MAATAFTLQVVPHASLNPVTMTATLGGFTHTAPCGPGVALLLNNTGSAANVTLNVPATTTFDGLVIPNRVILVQPGIALIPLVAADYADPVTGLATIVIAAGTFSGAVVYISA